MSNLLGGGRSRPAPTATPVPDPDGAEARAARLAQLRAIQQRSGRESTILSGGGAYGSSQLGAN